MFLFPFFLLRERKSAAEACAPFTETSVAPSPSQLSRLSLEHKGHPRLSGCVCPLSLFGTPRDPKTREMVASRARRRFPCSTKRERERWGFFWGRIAAHAERCQSSSGPPSPALSKPRSRFERERERERERSRPGVSRAVSSGGGTSARGSVHVSKEPIEAPNAREDDRAARR